MFLFDIILEMENTIRAEYTICTYCTTSTILLYLRMRSMFTSSYIGHVHTTVLPSPLIFINADGLAAFTFFIDPFPDPDLILTSSRKSKCKS